MDDQSIAMIPGERMLLRANGGILTLTNRRVRLVQQSGGAVTTVSITLGSVVSCSLEKTSYPALLGVAFIAAVIGLMTVSGSGELASLFFFAALALVGAFLLGRKVTLAIESAGPALPSKRRA